MFDFIVKSLAGIFGTASERELKLIYPYVDQINTEFSKLASISDDELRNQTKVLINEIAESLKDIDNEINELKDKANNSTKSEHKQIYYEKVDKLEKQRNEELEKTLLVVLPRAFAVVKETARRYAQNGQLVVTATDYDKKIASKKANVVIENNQAIWKNKWMAAGAEVTWEMVHYDVQLIGGVILHQGKIAEMATGEGKTLVATLPSYLNAIAKRGVHIVTVNDYLAKRDSEWMAPLFEFHEISVDCIDKYQPHSEERKQAYLADITYGTNNEFGFDYLRDNMVKETEELVQRKHHYAMVDEVDSVLIDDARTPLIISGPLSKSGDEHLFSELKPRVIKLVEEQKKLVNGYLVEAKKLLAEGNEKEGGLALFRAYRGLPKNKPLIKFLSEPGIRQVLQKTENNYIQDNSRLMPEADKPLFFTIDEKHNSIDLTVKGIDLITTEGEDGSFFILPDIGVELAKIENDTQINEEQRLEKSELLINDYTMKSARVHTVNQLLKAYCLFEKDTEYIIVEGKIKIVDEQTGRVMEGRRYSDGLHQALEAKENVKVENASQTYATITLQNYFRMYHKLAGMTGTAETEASEFWEIYKLPVSTIPTNKPTSRKDEQDKVYKTMREKFNAVAEEIVKLNEQGRPVLVGTTSVEISEILSRMLSMRKIKHNVLNAKQHQREAEIVAEAGKPGTVTIATNMAGRGTDIKLTAESKAAGGLAIIGTERHESRRVDRQLRGRAGRQGDPGSSQFFVSLEDSLMRLFGSEKIAKLMDFLKIEEGEVIQHSSISKSIERAQKKVEENNFGMRKRLLEYDDVMNKQREVIYQRRRNALMGDKLSIDIINMVYDVAEEVVQNAKDGAGYENFRFNFINIFGFVPEYHQADFDKNSIDALFQHMYVEAENAYNLHKNTRAQKCYELLLDIRNKGITADNVTLPLSDGKKVVNITVDINKGLENKGQELNNAMEKFATLAIIDQGWIEHLRDMDDLKQSVQNAVYEQKDPLLIYKMEAFNLFKVFMSKVNEEILSFIFKSHLPDIKIEEVREPQRISQPRPELREIHQDLSSNEEEIEKPKQQPLVSQKIAGRNDKVSVQYMDGTIKKDVKFKAVEEDLEKGKCIIVDFA